MNQKKLKLDFLGALGHAVHQAVSKPRPKPKFFGKMKLCLHFLFVPGIVALGQA
jgi:hypothetical protein